MRATQAFRLSGHASSLNCSSPMASLSEVTTELAEIQTILQGDAFAAEVKEKMIKQLATKIHGLKAMSASAAHQLMSAL